ncbi:MAG: SDR family oxidoreductase [Solirubrobacteraceae bacterium]
MGPGAGPGLGEGIAAALERDGAHVVVADLDEASAQDVAAKLERASAATLDVSDWNAFHMLVQETVAAHGRLDVLVNNAARTVVRSFWEIDPKEWDEVIAVNLRSVFAGCRAAGAHMRARGAGRIVNVASLAGQQGGLAGGAHYAASKAGIVVLTKIVAAELAPHGVTVNAIAPAAIAGPVMDGLPEERRRELEGRIPLGRLGSAQEVGSAVAFLASEHASFITGATIDVNGGLFMR